MYKFTRYESLLDAHVFITGGATGIGAALVDAFCSQGAKVSFVDIDEDSATALIDNIEKASTEGGAIHRPWFRKVDVTSVEALQDSVAQACLAHGPVQILVNNVANDTRHSPTEVTEQSWRQCMAVNLDAAFFAAQRVFEEMQRTAKGSIINISSINALLGPANMPGYVTAKAGLIGMTKALARDFGDSGVRVNAVVPGWIVTPRQLDTWLTPEEEAKWMELVALRRRIMPEDVASLILFLASDDSALITGQSFVIDGGRT